MELELRTMVPIEDLLGVRVEDYGKDRRLTWN